jgi:RNA polymerase sigma-70 factor (ECF subfamily)
MAQDDSISTRGSLVQRLKDPDDQSSWDEFYEIYRGLIFSVARRAGLSESEASDVVQDTMVYVARKMPGFTYDPAKDSFKGWLLTVTRWRIHDRLAGNARQPGQLPHASGAGQEEIRTATIDRVPDPAESELTGIWEEEWEAQLLRTALAHIRRQVQPEHYQIYHLLVVLGQPAAEVARGLEVSLPQVYLAKHRVGTLLKKEIKALRQTLL